MCYIYYIFIIASNSEYSREAAPLCSCLYYLPASPHLRPIYTPTPTPTTPHTDVTNQLTGDWTKYSGITRKIKCSFVCASLCFMSAAEHTRHQRDARTRPHSRPAARGATPDARASLRRVYRVADRRAITHKGACPQAGKHAAPHRTQTITAHASYSIYVHPRARAILLFFEVTGRKGRAVR